MLNLYMLQDVSSKYFFLFQSIIFIRDKNARGQEISGYIDFAHRLKTEDFEPYFTGKKRLLPRPSDLRYYQSSVIIMNQIVMQRNQLQINYSKIHKYVPLWST